MTKRIKKTIDTLMGQNLKRMREERGWSQEQLAELANTDRRYISAIENGRGMGKDLLDRLCTVFEVNEEAFTRQELQGDQELTPVIRMILEELLAMPEYEQLRLLADLKEKRAKRT